MKKILVLISGKLNFLKEDNYFRLLKSLENYDVNFFFTPWTNQNNELEKKMLEIYKPIKVSHIKEQNFESFFSEIKYPDLAANIQNIFFNWMGVSLGIKKIKKFIYTSKWKPDYILRYRTDILPKKKITFKIPNNFTENDVLIPDRYHWHGINDQIFLFHKKNINVFEEIYTYIITDFVKRDSLFASEYLFYKYLNEKKIRVIFNLFDYNLMRETNYKKNILNNFKKTTIPFDDKMEIKKLKFFHKIRNFKDYFIKKNNRNNLQDLII